MTYPRLLASFYTHTPTLTFRRVIGPGGRSFRVGADETSHCTISQTESNNVNQFSDAESFCGKEMKELNWVAISFMLVRIIACKLCAKHANHILWAHTNISNV